MPTLIESSSTLPRSVWSRDRAACLVALCLGMLVRLRWLCLMLVSLAALSAATVSPELITGSWELETEHTVRAQIEAAVAAGTTLEAGIARERIQAHAPRTLAITQQEMTLTRPTVTESMAYEVVASSSTSITVHGAQQAADTVLTWTIVGATLVMDDVAPNGTSQRLVYVRP